MKKLLNASTPSLLNGTEFLVIEAIVAVKSKYLKLNDVSLASKKDLCVYQGAELPLECNKTLYSGMGPSVTGVAGDDQNMFMFYRNKSSPNCCPSTFSTSTGCVCTTQDQRDYIARRGMVAPNQ